MGEDEGAGCMGNSGMRAALVGKERELGRRIGSGKVLFDFISGMRSAHAYLARSALLIFKEVEHHTTAIISYNMAPSAYLHRLRA